ncbi:hypothetical protein [Clostridium estertheticum]|uniref:hypothetical protein n=1 Tax=Clostridium estertheticum TaxID=238834 RepID=UPI001CF5D8ED|nr:hypothetical protein [Clostridium estertheticum]MCB2361037.1 hypothetical protein [Clostridium estertheticum]
MENLLYHIRLKSPNKIDTEFSNRRYMSLLVLEPIYGKDEESRENAKNKFGLEHEILT